MSHQAGLLDRITFNVNQNAGHPSIRNMRIRVRDVLDMLAGGATQAEILADFPYLEAENFAPALNTPRCN